MLRGLSRPVLYDYDPVFLNFYEEVTEKLRTALRTAHMPVILQGEPVLGLEAGAASLIARDDGVLNLVSGVYGAGFGFWAKRYCRGTDSRSACRMIGSSIRRASRRMLKSRPEIRVVAVCHHDTPSGTINPWPRSAGSSRRTAPSAGRRGLLVRRHGCGSRQLPGRSVRDRAE